jgi:DNA-binding NarL/FixJ family response regulator
MAEGAGDRSFLASIRRNILQQGIAALLFQVPLQGLTNKDIGLRLQISESAVKSSLRILFDKLGVRTRAQVVKVALEKYRDQL